MGENIYKYLQIIHLIRMYNIYKLLERNNKKTNDPRKTYTKYLMDFSPKKIDRWSIDT